MKKVFSLCIAIVLIIFTACSDDDANPDVGTLAIEFDNIVSSSNLELNTADTPYANSHAEAYKVTWLTYYVSNITLKREDGTIYTDEVKPDGSAGYYLVDEADTESQRVVLKDVPKGDYTEVTFTIGVDASQVDEGAQTGALDPANGLFWSWNSGYIFMAIEGVSPVSTEAEDVFQYHIGGYKEDAANVNLVNNMQTITLGFGDHAPVKPEHQPEVHIVFDVNKLLNGAGESVSFAANASRHSPKACEDLADNIPAAFAVDHVHAN
jgi:hypothetical protein